MIKLLTHFNVLVFMLLVFQIIFTPLLFCADDPPPEMIQSWKERAMDGDPYIPFYVGSSYKHGRGVKKDLAEAAKWFQMGAERGDYQAALELARMYLSGQGIQKDETKAVEWYVKIGKSNTCHAPSARLNLLILTRIYALGAPGISPDKTKASELFDHLFEIETALMEHGVEQMQNSVDRIEGLSDAALEAIEMK